MENGKWKKRRWTIDDGHKKVLGCSNIQFSDIQYSMKGRSGARGSLASEHGPAHEVRVIGREERKDLSDAFGISEAGARG